MFRLGRSTPSASLPLETLLRARAFPAFVGAITAAVVAWVGSAFRWNPMFHDEAAYVLQAEIFSKGHWTAPSPPLPEFFEQIHVFVTPRLASKYPPGHSILLVPGIWSGFPGLMPVLLGGMAGGILFALARRVANPWIALFAWFFWVSAPGDLGFHATYLSEVTTTALLLLAWWFLLEWRDHGRPGWLVLVSACMGWSALTRPFSTLALLVPLGVVVLRLVIARSRWRDLVLAGAFGALVLMVIPAWNAATTGDWRVTPYALYSRLYFPYQRPGFGAPVTDSLRPLPEEIRVYADRFRALHAHHTPANLPSIGAARLAALSDHMWRGWRQIFLVFAVVGLFSLTPEAIFGLVSALALVLQYLLLAHTPDWTVYYLEIQPVFAFVTALGLWRAVSELSRHRSRARAAGSAPASSSVEATCVLAVVVAGILPATVDAAHVRDVRREQAAPQEHFREQVRSLPGRSIVFVRHGPGHDPHHSLVENEGDLERAPVWIVHDRGGDDARLIRLASDRTPYLYDEARGVLIPLPPGGGAAPL